MKLRFAFSLLFALIGFESASATSLNIDFGTTFGTPSSSFGASANQSGTWNTISSSGTTALVGLSGLALPGVTLDLSASGNLSLTGSQGTPGLSANEQALVGDNFFVNAVAAPQSWSVKLSGLTNGNYSVFAYAPSNTAVATSNFTINGAAQTEIAGQPGPTASSPLQLGIDFLVATAIVTDGTMLIESGSSNFGFHGLAGLQLVDTTATPLPAAMPLFATGLGLLGVFTQRRRRRAAGV